MILSQVEVDLELVIHVIFSNVANPQLASKQQLLIAIHQALLAWSGGKAITKTVHSEIMHCLSIGNNVRGFTVARD